MKTNVLYHRTRRLPTSDVQMATSSSTCVRAIGLYIGALLLGVPTL
ncbi:MAG: hypothetical protein M3296_05065 [Actinomycetota bacterium]|nr:hypothetical protein [Actinomycetota bacterium]